MFKMKPRSLYKAGWVRVDGEDKCVIDSNNLVAERIEEWEALRRANAATVPSFDEEDGEGEGESAEFVSGLPGEDFLRQGVTVSDFRRQGDDWE